MRGDLRDPVTQSYGIPSDMQPDPGETLPSGRVPGRHPQGGGASPACLLPAHPVLHLPMTQPLTGSLESQKGGKGGLASSPGHKPLSHKSPVSATEMAATGTHRK